MISFDFHEFTAEVLVTVAGSSMHALDLGELEVVGVRAFSTLSETASGATSSGALAVAASGHVPVVKVFGKSLDLNIASERFKGLGVALVGEVPVLTFCVNGIKWLPLKYDSRKFGGIGVPLPKKMPGLSVCGRRLIFMADSVKAKGPAVDLANQIPSGEALEATICLFHWKLDGKGVQGIFQSARG